jgi:hypothetical protein
MMTKKSEIEARFLANSMERYVLEKSSDKKLFGEMALDESQKMLLAKLVASFPEKMLSKSVYEKCLKAYEIYKKEHGHEYFDKEMLGSFLLQYIETWQYIDMDVIGKIVSDHFVIKEFEFQRYAYLQTVDLLAVYSRLRDAQSVTIVSFDIKKNIYKKGFSELKANINEYGWVVFLHYCFCSKMLYRQLNDEELKYREKNVKKSNFPKKSILGRVWRFIKKIFPSYKDWE